MGYLTAGTLQGPSMVYCLYNTVGVIT